MAITFINPKLDIMPIDTVITINWKSLKNSLSRICLSVTYFFIFYLLSFIFLRQPTFAAIRYPITELGNCRNANECYLYCQIPQNTPACWAYAKFRLPAVLGQQDTTIDQQTKLADIKFPISTLGNCKSATDCYNYCQQSANQTSCIAFTKSQGLYPKDSISSTPKLSSKIITAAKSELGCDSEQSCLTICQQPGFYEKCNSFAQKYKLDASQSSQKLSRTVLSNAKKELGCDSEIVCGNFCNQEENKTRCTEFAKKNKLYKETAEEKEYLQIKKKMLEEAKTELGCDTFESCSAYCSRPASQEKCLLFGKKYQRSQMQQTESGLTSKPRGCATEAECKAYCEKNPNQCPGYTSSGKSVGDYLGPGGCKTEDECRLYCEKHPTECPGFDKTDSQTLLPTTSKPIPQTTYYPTPNQTIKESYPTGTSENSSQYDTYTFQSTTYPLPSKSEPTDQPASLDQYSYPTP